MITLNLPTLFVIALFAGVGAYFGSYLREKGKNLATHEDIDRVVRATEEIKAEISGSLWLRQSGWSLTREVYFDLLRALHDATHALAQLAFLDEKERDVKFREMLPETRKYIDKYLGQLSTSLENLRHVEAVARVVLGTEAMKILATLISTWAEYDKQHTATSYERLGAAVSDAADELAKLARRDLGVAPTSAEKA
jgi:hypothetical protein